MASLSDGLMPSMPDFASNPSFSSTGDMKRGLQRLLDSKEKQLQQAGALGQRVLAQQMELEERIRQLQELDAEKSEEEQVDREARERYRELADTMQTWDTENVKLSSAFSSKRVANGKQPSPTLSFHELPTDEPDKSKASNGTSAAQSRRAKNAAHRADDVEFAFEIGSGLLTEVRRLQALLGERDKAIQDMKEEKDDVEKSVESLRTALRQQEQSADKFKEENWNLEVTLQELRVQLTDSQATTQRLEGEQKRTNKLLASSRDSGEQHKNESERLHNALEDLKAKHETDIATARKNAAGLQRDKSDLQSSLDSLKAEAARATRRLPRFGSPLTPNGAAGQDYLTPGERPDDDVFGNTGGASTNRRKLDTSAMLFPPDEYDDASPDVSPARAPFLASNHPSNEIEALQQRLAHAQRQITTLKGTLQREKELRIDYKRKLEASPGGFTPEAGQEDDDELGYEDEELSKPRPKPTPFRSGGRRGRGRGGLTLVQRLGMASHHSPQSEYNDDNDFVDLDTPPPVPRVPSRFQEEDEHEEEHDSFDVNRDTRSPSPPLSNRASVDGMDPAFANILRRAPSTSSIPLSASPLRHAVVARTARGGAIARRKSRRGGAAYQEARPTSLIGAPEALAAEFGFGSMSPDVSITKDDSLLTPLDGDDDEEDEDSDPTQILEEKQTAEFGCQTDFVEPPPPVVVRSPTPPPVAVQTGEMGVQVEPEPVPEVVVVPKSEMSIQTEPEPAPMPIQAPAPPPTVVVPTSEMSMQTEPEPTARPLTPPPLVVLPLPVATIETSMQTDEIPVVPVPETHEIAIQHDYVEPRPSLVSASTNTDPEVVHLPPVIVAIPPTPLPVRVQAETQTSYVRTLDADVQTTPVVPVVVVPVVKFSVDTQTPAVPETFEAETQTALSVSIVAGDLSSPEDVTVLKPSGPRTFLAQGDDADDGDETETGADTETETETEDDYQDARQSIMLSTPSQSNDDFHSVDDFQSVLSMTDNDYSDTDDDGESIKASRLPSRQSGLSVASSSIPRRVSASSIPRSRKPSYYAAPAPSPPAVSYESVSVGTDPVEEPAPAPVVAPTPPPPVQLVEEPKPEQKEMSIQTDEWVPPTPVPVVIQAPAATPAPVVPAGFGLYRVGSGVIGGQQFQFIPPPTTPGSGDTSTATIMPTPSSPALRESVATFGVARSRTSTSGRSFDSSRSSIIEDNTSRSRVHSGSALSPIVDKTRPPMMMLPPPPRLPPPPSSMPPPSFIPERRTASAPYSDTPPPRPSSPPPPDLIHRATTPTFGSVLSLPNRNGNFGLRQHGGSLPPHQGMRQPPSTSSFRSALNAATYTTPGSYTSPSALSSFSVRERERREMSTTSLVSERSMASPRSSISSEHHMFTGRPQQVPLGQPLQQQQQQSTPAPGAPGSATDPNIIHAITQTMIGEFLYKYTRRAMGKGHGEKRHKRFFWVHPYTKTLYWSSADPGSSNVSESSAKSAYIEGVRSVLDPNPMPPGLYQYSVLVSTPQREMKITAPTKERHDLWFNALKYLLSRPDGMPPGTPGPSTAVPSSPLSSGPGDYDDPPPSRPILAASPQSQRTSRSVRAGDTWNTTPRGGQRSRSQMSMRGSVGKRSGTPALEYLRYAPDSPYANSFEHVASQDGEDENDMDFELHGDGASDDGFEGMENVRACCDGRHTVGPGGKHVHHHNHNHERERSAESHLDVQQPHERPVSPAWSFRSRAGSTHSRDETGSLFGKLRFGSKRGTKGIPPLPGQGQ